MLPITIAIVLCAGMAGASGAELALPIAFPMLNNTNILLNSRIINGKPAWQAQIPWQASILSRRATSASMCGGSLIHPSWVLTACHCTRGFTSFGVRLGSLFFNSGGVLITASQAIEHPAYNPANLNNDISLLQLSASPTLSASIKPIRLPRRAQQSQSFNGIISYVSGFGLTSDGGQVSNQLNYVGIRIIANALCAMVFGPEVIRASTMCGVGNNALTQSTCNGDSGGPLVTQEAGGIFTQIGVVSFVAGVGCSKGYPSGYVRTSHFVDWIQAITGIPVRN